MKRSIKDESLRIARDMHAIKLILIRQGFRVKDADEIAFHIAEVTTELTELIGFAKKITGGKRVTSSETDMHCDLFEFHTYYHLRLLYKAFRRRRIFAEQTEEISASSKRGESIQQRAVNCAKPSLKIKAGTV